MGTVASFTSATAPRASPVFGLPPRVQLAAANVGVGEGGGAYVDRRVRNRREGLANGSALCIPRSRDTVVFVELANTINGSVSLFLKFVKNTSRAFASGVIEWHGGEEDRELVSTLTDDQCEFAYLLRRGGVGGFRLLRLRDCLLAERTALFVVRLQLTATVQQRCYDRFDLVGRHVARHQPFEVRNELI